MVQARYTQNSGSVDYREIQLLVCSPQPVEQIEYLVDHPVGARTRAIHFIDHHNRVQTLFECLGRHKSGLRHRAIHGINQ